MMAQEIILKPTGLWTHPSPHTDIPPGALITALNVVNDRDGVIEPRPGFEDALAGISVPAGYQITSIVPFDGGLLLWCLNGATWRVYKLVSGVLTQMTNHGDPPDSGFILTKSAEARKNIYATSSGGTKKLWDISATAFENAGVLPPTLVLTTNATADTWLADQSQVTYRAVARRKDNNGLIVRSSPSPRCVHTNAAGAARRVSASVYLNTDAAAGDVIELYRSATTPRSTPNEDDLALVTETTLTAAHVSAMVVTVSDIVQESARGAFIYTAPSQEGIEQANDTPPSALDMAQYRGSMFFANGGHRFVFTTTLSDVGGVETAADTGVAGNLFNTTGIAYLKRGGLSTTVGLPTISGFASVAGIRVGMLISDISLSSVSSAQFATGTTVSAVGATTVTASTDATATTAAQSIAFRDVFKIGAQLFVFGLETGVSTTYQEWDPPPAATASNNDRCFFAAASIVESANAALRFQDGYFVPGFDILSHDGAAIVDAATRRPTFAVVADTFPTTAGTISTSNPASFYPSSSTANFVVQSTPTENVLMWSKQDEPEHVPVLNFVQIGAENHPIRRIIPTRDALWIFKDDGIWRLTGEAAASGWRLDPFDPSAHLLIPECAVELLGKVYAWTNNGIVEIGDSDYKNISHDRIGGDLGAWERFFQKNTEDSHPFMVADPVARRLLLNIEGTLGGSAEATVYCYSLASEEWTLWQLPSSAGAFNPADGKEYFSRFDWASGFVLAKSRINIDPTQHFEGMENADRSYAITVTVVSGQNITIGAGSGWTPAVGDAIQMFAGGYIYSVVEVTSPTVFKVDAAGAITGTRTAYEGFTSTIDFRNMTSGNPGQNHLWTSGMFEFQSLTNTVAYSARFRSDLAEAVTSVSFSQTNPSFTIPALKPYQRRFWVPRNFARVTSLIPGFSIRQALSGWALRVLSINNEAMAERVAQT